MADTVELRVAMRIGRRMERDYQGYLDDCEADRRNGYRAHYCEHGTNLWTDYDNICGPCEDGITLRDPMTRRRLALDAAKDCVREARELMSLVATAARLRVAHAIDEQAVWKQIDSLLAYGA